MIPGSSIIWVSSRKTWSFRSASSGHSHKTSVTQAGIFAFFILSVCPTHNNDNYFENSVSSLQLAAGERSQSYSLTNPDKYLHKTYLLQRFT